MNFNQIHPFIHIILDGCPLANSSSIHHLNPNAVDVMNANNIVYLIRLSHDSLDLGGLDQVLWHEIKAMCTVFSVV